VRKHHYQRGIPRWGLFLDVLENIVNLLGDGNVVLLGVPGHLPCLVEFRASLVRVAKSLHLPNASSSSKCMPVTPGGGCSSELEEVMSSLSSMLSLEDLVVGFVGGGVLVALAFLVTAFLVAFLAGVVAAFFDFFA
jgi:hypothetical protein